MCGHEAPLKASVQDEEAAPRPGSVERGAQWQSHHHKPYFREMQKPNLWGTQPTAPQSPKSFLTILLQLTKILVLYHLSPKGFVLCFHLKKPGSSPKTMNS